MGLALSVGGIAGILAQTPAGALVDQVLWERTLIAAGCGLAFGVLPIRAVLYTLTSNTVALVAIQILNGVGAGIFGVVSVLVIGAQELLIDQCGSIPSPSVRGWLRRFCLVIRLFDSSRRDASAATLRCPAPLRTCWHFLVPAFGACTSPCLAAGRPKPLHCAFLLRSRTCRHLRVSALATVLLAHVWAFATMLLAHVASPLLFSLHVSPVPSQTPSVRGLLRLVSPFGLPALARRRRVRGVTPTRLTDSRQRRPSNPLLHPCSKLRSNNGTGYILPWRPAFLAR